MQRFLISSSMETIVQSLQDSV